MTLGNTKHTIVLGIVAVGAIGFLGMTIVKAGSKASGTQAAPVKSAEEDPVQPEVTLELLADAFSHPLLTEAAREQAGQPKTVGQAPPPPMEGLETVGNFPLGIPGLPPGPVTLVGPGDKGPPAEVTGGSRKSLETQGPIVALSAIVKVNRSVAFIRLNNGESRSYQQGELIVPGLRLLAIGEGFVRLRTPTRELEVRVGEEVRS
jgi:hypothetical protein